MLRRSIVRVSQVKPNLLTGICKPVLNTKNIITIINSSRSYSTKLSNYEVPVEAKYDNIQDYGSYKHNIFTHRLPESSASQSPPLVALHARLNLPSSYSLSTLSQALNLNRYDDGLANNFGLNVLGKNMLSYYVNEWLLIRYPRLPMPVHNVAVNALMGPQVMYEIGKQWGIEVDKSSKLDKFLSQESQFLKYGRLRFIEEESKYPDKPAETGIYELTNEEVKSLDKQNSTFISEEVNAYSSAVIAIIGGLYTHAGEEATKEFINNHILSRKLPLENMFEFSQPTRELVRLCDKLQFEDPIDIRLIAETGRLSAHAIYVAGVFCGVEKLGEGVGSSLAEARTRAVINSLMGYYLYSPIDNEGNEVKLPSDEEYKFDGIIGPGDIAI
ncbi:uncharacterized protein RJT21DRAFT_120974 [Scheffersomyces amazonensis]|uniref:uncharacterized protein n=1 Tax=Scheffersomyces amazonensis TaxID=1078765 RepID=UPI00315DBA48